MGYDNLPKKCYHCNMPARLYKKIIPAWHGEEETIILCDLCDPCANKINVSTYTQYILAED